MGRWQEPQTGPNLRPITYLLSPAKLPRRGMEPVVVRFSIHDEPGEERAPRPDGSRGPTGRRGCPRVRVDRALLLEGDLSRQLPSRPGAPLSAGAAGAAGVPGLPRPAAEVLDRRGGLRRHRPRRQDPAARRAGARGNGRLRNEDPEGVW